jgi:hypothetical protein
MAMELATPLGGFGGDGLDELFACGHERLAVAGKDFWVVYSE